VLSSKTEGYSPFGSPENRHFVSMTSRHQGDPDVYELPMPDN
jgi:hypothetical protein